MGVTRIETGSTAMSLFWDGDELVDVVGRWDADGAESLGVVGWGYPFDQAIVSPSGRFHVIYAERGTKAAVLADGRIIRELNRSFAHATDYDYPWRWGGSRTGGRSRCTVPTTTTCWRSKIWSRAND